MRLMMFFLLLWAPTAFAQQPAPSEAWAFQAFIDRAGPTCSARPAQACVDAGWRFAAPAPELGLTPGDLQALRRRVGVWYDWRQPGLTAREGGLVALGLLLVDGIGIGRLHGAFDGDGDGRITQQELLADVKLDSRPLGEVLADPAAVDRARLAQRLGLPPALVESLLREHHRPASPGGNP